MNQFAQSTPALHAPMRLYAEYAVALFAAVLLVAWLWARRDRNPRSMASALWAPAGALLTHRCLGAATAVAAVAAVVMAFARVYVGVHFPLDVIVGLLLDAAVTCSGYLAVRPLLIRVAAGSSRTPPRPLLTTAERSLSR
ncbi:phosphatase PAP2 family protein [Nocardioides sp. InS609-2]|uniref:phosphatase PAP2 family protein n=1 Tax=Nocardioides sp. InS609-2 TaxID=2760705 RepID=UPI0020BF6969|nr:phosphatase PAP2 family protein [Nocardioides sp. InS609-2]